MDGVSLSVQAAASFLFRNACWECTPHSVVPLLGRFSAVPMVTRYLWCVDGHF